MAYLHEQRLNQAIRKLYLLGNRPYRGGPDVSGDFGTIASLGSALQEDIRKHDAARDTQVGGYDTHTGAETKMKSATARGQDLNTGRQLMYMGGLMNTPLGAGPGGTRGPGMGPGNF